MKRLFTSLLCCLGTLLATATSVGEWTSYLAYHANTANQPVGTTVYGLFNGNLLAYNTSDTEVKLFSKIDGMSDRHISFLGYSTSQRCLVLVYDSDNVDLYFPESGTFVNLPQLAAAASTVGTVQALNVNGDYAALATDAGVAVLHLARQEVQGFYPLEQSIATAAVAGDKVYAATGSTLLCGALTDNLYDRTQWTSVSGTPTVATLLPFGGLLYLLTEQNGLWKLDPGTTAALQQVSTVNYTHAFADATHAVLSNASTIDVFTAGAAASQSYAFANTGLGCSRAADGTFWMSNGADGLTALTAANGTLTPTGTTVGGYGPIRDLAYAMRMNGERLLIAGGRLDRTFKISNEGTAMYYDGKWTNFTPGTASADLFSVYTNFTGIAQDPSDATHHFVSAGGSGLLEFRDGAFVAHYGLLNSPLTAVEAGNDHLVRVDGLSYDADGNLWMTNQQADTLLRIRRPDGTWRGLYHAAIAGYYNIEKTLFDSKGRLWATSREWVGSRAGGLFCLDLGGTAFDASDDTMTFRSSALNEDGTSCDFRNGVYCLAEDRNGQIWFGSYSGVYVVENPDTWSESSFTVLQVKVPRNDGTNYADYLLAGVPVTAIAIDGANRKWLGTAASGLFLVSADGTEILHHFRAADSPLPSDNILSLAVNNTTGEVFIGTESGLVSYQGEATEPAVALDADNVKVYPNPVRPEYNGTIQITGLTENADVKIMTVSGQAVAGGTSTGGTFAWDGRNFNGRRVATGVYYVLVATADGKKAIAAKIVVI